jgi:pyruvate formate lyase activating enzyme
LDFWVELEWFGAKIERNLFKRWTLILKGGPHHMEKITGIITEFKRYAVYDGPGIRTTVFVKGCPLRCKWCCNPETWESHPQLYFKASLCKEFGSCIKACPTGTISMVKEHKINRTLCSLCMKCVGACPHGALSTVGRRVTPEEVVREVEKDTPFYRKSGGGVTVSGGEPLFQPNFVSRIFELCHKKGISTVLDTCGYAEPNVVERVLEHVDLVLLDIKHMNPTMHKRLMGVSNEFILENAKLMASKCHVRISLPLIKGINDSEENIRKTIEFTKSLNLEHIDIEPLHKLGGGKYEMLGMKDPFSDFEEVSSGEIEKIVKIIESYGLKATEGRTM